MKIKKIFSKLLVIAMLLSILPVNALQVAADNSADDSLVVHYDMTTDGSTLTDVSGNGHNGIFENLNQKYFMEDEGETVVNFIGGKTYVKLPYSISEQLSNSVTIHTRTKTNNDSWAQFLWFLGAGTNTSTYLFMNPRSSIDQQAIRAGIKTGSTEERLSGLPVMTPNVYHDVTVTAEGSMIKLYIDGVLSSTLTHGRSLSAILDGDGSGYAGYIAKSPYGGDPPFRGKLADFRIYNKVLSDGEVAALHVESKVLTDQEKADAVAAGLQIPNADQIRGSITLASEVKGAAITWTSPDNSANEVIDLFERPVTGAMAGKNGYSTIPAGVVTRPTDNDKMVKLRATVEYGMATSVKDFTLTVKKAAKELRDDDFTAYFLTHFIGTEKKATDEQTYFAVSQDANYWEDLHVGGTPNLISDIGTQGVRDQYIIRSPEGDKFYMIATDLSVYHSGGWSGGWSVISGGSSHIVVWESTDLVEWSQPWLLNLKSEGVGSAWAPEIVHDTNTDEYIIFWASKSLTNQYYTINYVKTRDFRTVTEDKVLMNYTNATVIDTTFVKHNGYYYRAVSDGQISISKSTNLLEPSVWTANGTSGSRVVSGDWVALGNIHGATGLTGNNVEGAELFQLNKKDWTNPNVPEFALMVDQYSSGKGYRALRTTDMDDPSAWKATTAYNSGTTLKRHGGFVNITQEEYDRLIDARDNVSATSISFDFETMALRTGKSKKANITFMPANTTNKSLTWETSDISVATVENGVVTPKSEGKATITATTNNGKSASCTVIVEENYEKLIADFNFNDSATGLKGAGAKATENGTAVYSDSFDEENGKAISISSSNWLTVTKEDGSPLLKDLEEITISYYSKSTNTSSQGWAFYAAPNTNTQIYQQEHYLGIMDRTTGVTVERYHNSGARPGSNLTGSSSANWKHVELVITEADTTLYIDGTLQDSRVSTYKLSDIVDSTGGIIQIGKGNWGSGEYFTGLIDNFKIYAQDESQAEDQRAIQEVEKKIAAIGTVTLDSKVAIKAARTAYDALKQELKHLVTNVSLLIQAEAKYEAEVKAAIQAADKAAASEVEDKINAIGTVTAGSKEAIAAAEKAYQTLSAEQKKLVTNYKVLVDAKATYESLNKLPAKGAEVKVGKYRYQVTRSATKNGTVKLIKPVRMTMKKVVIPSKVKINKYSFKVTAIAAKAFKGSKKLQSVTVGKNIRMIGKQAFRGCG